MQVVQDTVTEAVQDAVAQAFEDNGRFDVRANFYTLIAITGVVLYWRGVWNSWYESLLCLQPLPMINRPASLYRVIACLGHARLWICVCRLNCWDNNTCCAVLHAIKGRFFGTCIHSSSTLLHHTEPATCCSWLLRHAHVFY